ncbi:conserved hypothetical protein [Methanocaldococcus infernus ME]|uniref:DNA replication complex GINS family protein n=2 Tax=Methanocaldococcus infernus TaxID=67760 RepID=D5VS90_METIM|nr:conserved hypothetical protein [Methanocaldococcus infernus ME]
MYEKLVKAFIMEIKEDKLLELENNFYEEVRDYVKTLQGEEKERALYFYRELRKLRLYKAFYGDRDNLVEEEVKILESIEKIHEEEKKEEPKDIYTLNNIELVRVLLNFPSFTDGKRIYNLEKNDILSIDEKIAKILEKHSIVKRFKVEP